MIPGSRAPIRPCRATVAACLALLTISAQLVVVCEGEEHVATEWLFSSCCAPPGIGSSRDLAPGSGSEPAGMASGRCADACVDTLLLVAATEPTAPPSGDKAASNTPLRETGAIAHRVEHGREPAAPSRAPCLPRVAESSTVLLI